MSGEPVFIGTRVPLGTLIRLVEHAGRAGLEEFLEGFDVIREQAMAALKEQESFHWCVKGTLYLTLIS